MNEEFTRTFAGMIDWKFSIAEGLKKTLELRYEILCCRNVIALELQISTGLADCQVVSSCDMACVRRLTVTLHVNDD
jgi:hypothetical protein